MTRSEGSNIPLILVGFSYFGPPPSPCGTNISLFTAFKRLSANLWLSAGLGVGGPSAVSISLAGNVNTGDCYLALSHVQGSIEVATLAIKNMWSNSPAQQITLLNRRAIVSVAAFNDYTSRFRIAVSDFTQGSNGYGPAWYRSGAWAAGVSAPTWDGPQVSASSNARDVQALNSEYVTIQPKDPCNGELTRRFALIDERKSNTSFDILLDSDKITVALPCSATSGNNSQGQ